MDEHARQSSAVVYTGNSRRRLKTIILVVSGISIAIILGVV